MVRNFWAVWRLQQPSFPSLLLWWDCGKDRLKGLAIRSSRDRAREQSASRSLLSRLHFHLKGLTDRGSASLVPVFENVSSSISQLDLSDAEGAKVCARMRWAEEGETSSKYYFRLERKPCSDGWIWDMHLADGTFGTLGSTSMRSYSLRNQ